MKRISFFAASSLAFGALAFSNPANAEIKAQSDAGFNVVHIAEVEASPEEIWRRLIAPGEYWSKEHSWSGSAAGLTIDPRAGGCFCETLADKPAERSAGKSLGKSADSKARPSGSVEHMRVIFAQPGKVLRMQGALGPLQSEAVLGTLTIAMQPATMKSGSDKPVTKLSFSYVVGGYMRYKTAEIAPAVDKVIGEQFASLIKPYARSGAIADKPSNWSLDLDGITGDAPPPEDEPSSETGKPAPGTAPQQSGKKPPASKSPASKPPQAKSPPARPGDAKKER
jgi:hypothetical protein